MEGKRTAAMTSHGPAPPGPPVPPEAGKPLSYDLLPQTSNLEPQTDRRSSAPCSMPSAPCPMPLWDTDLHR